MMCVHMYIYEQTGNHYWLIDMYICIDICRYVHTYVGVSRHILMYSSGFVKHITPGIQTCS